MSSSRTLITSQTLGTSASSVTFSNIPNSFTDLVLVFSTADTLGIDMASSGLYINSSSTPYVHSDLLMRGDPGYGTTYSAEQRQTNNRWYYTYPGSNYSNTFNNGEVYIPNYVDNTYKIGNVFSVTSVNATTGNLYFDSGLVRTSSAVSTVVFSAAWSAFAAGSTFYLYGISRVNQSSAPSTPTSVSAAAGPTGTSQAAISFTPNGSTADSYKVTSTPESIVSYGKYSPVNVYGLTKGTSYTFTVSAVNNSGESTASSATNSVTPATYNNFFGQYFPSTKINSAISDSSGNIYIAGYSFAPFVAKLNSYGDILWQNRNNGDNSNGSVAGIDSSGNVYHVSATGTPYICIVKYNSSGTTQWQRKLSHSQGIYMGGNPYGANISFDSSDNLYVCGFATIDANNGYMGWVAKYNSSGTLQWQRKLTDSNSSYYRRVVFRSSAVDSSGNVYLCGDMSTTTNSFGYKAIVVKYNSSGTLQWQKSLADANTAANQRTQANAIACDSSGNTYVAGTYENTSAGGEMWVAKYNASGTLQWQRKFSDGTGGGGNIMSICIDSSSNVYTGSNAKTASSYATYIVKYNSSGTLQWQRTIANSSGGGQWPNSLFADNTASKLFASGVFYSTGFIGKLPLDGTGTGTYTLPLDSNTLTYASTSYMTDASGILTDGTPSLSSADAGFTDAAGTLSLSTGLVMGQIVGF